MNFWLTFLHNVSRCGVNDKDLSKIIANNFSFLLSVMLSLSVLIYEVLFCLLNNIRWHNLYFLEAYTYHYVY